MARFTRVLNSKFTISSAMHVQYLSRRKFHTPKSQSIPVVPPMKKKKRKKKKKKKKKKKEVPPHGEGV